MLIVLIIPFYKNSFIGSLTLHSCFLMQKVIIYFYISTQDKIKQSPPNHFTDSRKPLKKIKKGINSPPGKFVFGITKILKVFSCTKKLVIF